MSSELIGIRGKSFAVDGTRFFLKDLDAKILVFDEVVVVAEDSGDFALDVLIGGQDTV